MNIVKVKTQTQGQCFSTYACVKQGKKILHTTRDYPYGFTGPASEEAEVWAVDHGFSVEETI
jgi:hypothetical protein